MSAQNPIQSTDKKTVILDEIRDLQEKIEAVVIPPELKESIKGMIQRVNRLVDSTAYAANYETVSSYIDWVVNLPWGKASEDNHDLDRARRVLDEHHYGMEKVKERILEYLAVLNLQDKRRKEEKKKEEKEKLSFRATVLCLVGLPGIGKTTVAYSIAEALGKPFIRIAMGGMGSAMQLRGQSKAFPDAEPGQVIKNLRRAGVRNPLILLDEIDRVTEVGRAEIMGVLLELLDPEQNMAFSDHYLDYPFDLSRVMFICSCNNTRGIANAVLDRLELIQMPTYTDEEKMIIGKEYLFPKELKNTGLSPDDLKIEEEVWPQIIRPLGFDAGVRTLDRTIQGVCRKVAKKIVLGEGKNFVITSENVKEFLPSW